LKKVIIFLIFFTNIFAFEVEFTKVYKQYIVPKKDAVLIKTSQKELTFPFKFFKVDNGYILVGNIDNINYWLENDFYAPDDAEFKNIKVAIIDYDRIQYRIIKKIKNTYKSCEIKQIIFLSPDETKIITQPTEIEDKYKIILECK